MKVLFTTSLLVAAVLISACAEEKKEVVTPVAGEYPASVRIVVTEEGRAEALYDETKALELKKIGDKTTLEALEKKYTVEAELSEVEKSKQAVRVRLSGNGLDCGTTAYWDVALELPLVKLTCHSEKEEVQVSIFNNVFWNEKSEKVE